MTLQASLEKAWYGKAKWIWLLLPFTLLFACISIIRRWLYNSKLLVSDKPKIPVIVVGNISVGGNGKTPIVIAIAEFLTQKGYKVGILSRGYKGTCDQFPHVVTATDTSATVGDEPYLMFNRLNCDLVIDPVRLRGANALQEIGCNVIVCDDGLQHYALQRDIEIVVMDHRQLGNGYLLPMGPLREGVWRLNTINMLVCNGSFDYGGDVTQQVNMRLAPVGFVNVADTTQSLSIEDFVDRYPMIDAICAIGNPQRFYETIEALGIEVNNRQSFADHHHFVASDLPQNRLLMTEKDAVKCSQFACPDWWYLKIAADLPTTFYETISQQLNQLEKP